MRTKAVAAILVAFVMLTVGYAIVVDDQSGATGNNNGLAEYKFYVGTENNSDWSYVSTGVGYNAYIALQDAFSVVASETDCDSYTMTVHGYYGDYDTINPDYGTIKTIGGLSAGNGKVWNVFMYNNQNQWVKGPVDALGFYQGYSDYDSALRTANIILFLGDSSIDIDTILEIFTVPSGLCPITYIDNSSCYQVTYTINVSSMTMPDYLNANQWAYLQGLDGTVVYGYGSNCYTAFQNALTSVYGNSCMYDPLDQALSSDDYGYVSSILGIQENHVVSGNTSTWWYWSLHTGAPSFTNYSSYTAGFFTPLSGLTGFQYTSLYYNYEVSVY